MFTLLFQLSNYSSKSPFFFQVIFFNYPDSLSNSSPASLLELILSHWHIIYSIDITLARSSMRLIFLNLFDSLCLSYFSHQPYLTQLIPPSLKHFFILFSRFYMLLAFLLNWFLFCVFPPRSSSRRSCLIVGLTHVLVFDLSLSLLTCASSVISWGLGI